MSAKLEKVDIMPPRDDRASVPALQVVTPMTLLDRALSSGASLEMVTKLMDLQDRYKASQALEAFNEAMASAKAEIPTITKNREVDFTSPKGRTHYRYEDLGEIAKIVNPILAKHGLSYRYRTTSNVNEPVTVTCIVSHRDGHFEENTLCAGRDDSGNKNSIQQVGSTLTYLQRMTLKAALGLAVSNDDDGKTAVTAAEVDTSPPPPGSIAQDQADNIRDLLESLNVNARAFLNWAKRARVEDIPAAEYDSCVEKIKEVGTRK